MTTRAATDAARRVWARAAGDSRAPEDVTAAAEQLAIQLRTGLGRWIGAQGYRALLARAGGLARAEHPALGGLSWLGEDQPAITAAGQAQGTGEVTVGPVVLVAALIELLGRIIGEEMAVRLVEQSSMPSPRKLVSAETEGSRNG